MHLSSCPVPLPIHIPNLLCCPTKTVAAVRDQGVIGEQHKLTKQTIINPLKLSIYLHFGLEKLKMSNIDSTNTVTVYIRLSDRSETDMLTSSASLNEYVYSHNYVYNDRYTWFYESLFYITSYNLQANLGPN